MFRRKITYIVTVVLLSAGLFSGCVYDNIDTPHGDEYPEIAADAYAMSIDFNLGTYPTEYDTRSGGLSALGEITRVNFHPSDDRYDYWESYIDLHQELQNYSGDKYTLYVLMFDENNNFMYNPCGRDASGNVSNLFQVSTTGIVSNNEYMRWRAVFQVPAEVREYIRTHHFKIAVFANWPTNDVENPVTHTMDRIMPEEFTNNLPWGGRNPNISPNDPRYESEGPISIRKLARSVYDKTYGDKFSEVYYFLTEHTEHGAEGGRMGAFTDWVFNYHENQENAVLFTRGFIQDRLGHDRRYYEKRLVATGKIDHSRLVTPRVFRRNFDDEFASDDRIFIYQNLWNLWNFGGLYNARIKTSSDADYRQATAADINDYLVNDGHEWSPASLGNPAFNMISSEFALETDSQGLDKMYYGRSEYVSVWASRNHRRAMEAFGKVGDKPLIDYVYENKGEVEITTNATNNADFMFASFTDVDEILDHNEDHVDPAVTNGSMIYTGPNKAKLGKDDNGYVYLHLPSGGSRTKNCLSFKVFADAVLYVKSTGNITVASDSYRFEDSNLPSNSNHEEGGWFLDIPSDPSNVWIYSSDGTGKIYEVEMIQKKYLYDSDRRSLLPSSHQLVPMYGIQEFDPLGDYWIPGQIFDLSHDNGFNRPGYNHKAIYLLRSVARVEVLVSKEFKNKYDNYLPRLIMRSMNRTARCMPLDVITPTEKIWDEVDQEILNIREHGPFYTTEFGDDLAAEQEEFRNRLAWFYLKWVDLWDWTWNGWQPTTMNTTLTPPSVFNSKIDRADYVRMIKVDDNYDGYERYVLYMPDKAIDDADDAGDLSATPKVPHLEVRLKGESVSNLDDNNHERIYFMDYASTGGPVTSKDNNGYKTYDSYEKNTENLKKHWPVVRNHIYRFRVHPSGNENVSVTLYVAGAASRSVTIPDFE